MHEHTAICPYCGEQRSLQPLLTGDLARERRLAPHGAPEGTCPGSALIESLTGERERAIVIALRAMHPWSGSGVHAQA